MASRVCPACGGLNSESEATCYRCKRRLPSPVTGWAAGFLQQRQLVSRGITLICLVVFGLMVALDQRFPIAPELGFGEHFRISTAARFGALVTSPGAPIEAWRLISAIFVHGSMLHVGLNLWALLGFGAQIEDRFGPARAFLVFLLTGVGGFVASTIWYADSGQYTLGASGGLFGYLGTIIGVLITRKDPGWKDIVKQQLMVAAILALVLRVNTAAHLGGFVIGVGLGMLFERERPRPVTSGILGVMAVLGALASVGSIVLSSAAPLTKALVEYDRMRGE